MVSVKSKIVDRLFKELNMAEPKEVKKSSGGNKVANMDEKRIKLAIENNEPCKEVIIDLLEQTIQALKSGKINSNKCLMVLLEDYDGYYLHQTYSAGLFAAEGIALASLCLDDLKEELYGG